MDLIYFLAPLRVGREDVETRVFRHLPCTPVQLTANSASGLRRLGPTTYELRTAYQGRSLICTTIRRAMSSYAIQTPHGTEARRLTNQPVRRMASPEYQQVHHHKTIQDQGSPQKEGPIHPTLAKLDRTCMGGRRPYITCAHKYDSRVTHIPNDSKDTRVPYTFARSPHLPIIGRYSSNIDNINELVFSTRVPGRTISYA